jgi:hypothetical protein
VSDISQLILQYLEPALGEGQKRYHQVRFNCPRCDKGRKHNLEINVNDRSTKFLIYHCWSCHFKGHISWLLKEFAENDNWEQVSEFKTTTSKKFQPAAQQNEIKLPQHIIPYHNSTAASDYLINTRTMSERFLKQRNVKYVYSEYDELYNNIIFPHYVGNKLVGFTSHNLATKKYRNHGKLNFVACQRFINPYLPIVITEGIYDAGSVLNGIPLLGTRVNNATLQYCQSRKLILALDTEVAEDSKLQMANEFIRYGAEKVALFDLMGHKDLNEMFINEELLLKQQLLHLFQTL